MKKIKAAILGLLLALFCLPGLLAEQSPVFTFATNMYPFGVSLITPEGTNWWTSFNGTELGLFPSWKILTQFRENSNPPMEEQQNLISRDSELMNMLYLQMANLLNLETQWQAMKEHYSRLSIYNGELLKLLDGSKNTIALLRQNLEAALERVQDAEGGAIALLKENNEIYQKAKLTMANIASLQQQLARAKRGSVIGFAFGSVSFGAGVPLAVTGLTNDNHAMLYAGLGITAGGSAIWALGHFAFNWW